MEQNLHLLMELHITVQNVLPIWDTMHNFVGYIVGMKTYWLSHEYDYAEKNGLYYAQWQTSCVLNETIWYNVGSATL